MPYKNRRQKSTSTSNPNEVKLDKNCETSNSKSCSKPISKSASISKKSEIPKNESDGTGGSNKNPDTASQSDTNPYSVPSRKPPKNSGDPNSGSKISNEKNDDSDLETIMGLSLIHI